MNIVHTINNIDNNWINQDDKMELISSKLEYLKLEEKIQEIALQAQYNEMKEIVK